MTAAAVELMRKLGACSHVAPADPLPLCNRAAGIEPILANRPQSLLFAQRRISASNSLPALNFPIDVVRTNRV